MYAVIELLAIYIRRLAIILTGNPTYLWFAAIYTGLVAASTNLWMSLWFLCIACPIVFGIFFVIAIATFKQFFGFSYKYPIALYIIYIFWPLICVLFYVISQLILVFRTLEDVADRRYHLWHSFLRWRSSSLVRIQRYDMRCDQTLYR